MNWRVTLSGTDITAYVSGVQTSFARGNICGECTVELADASVISGLVIPRVPRVPSIFVEADFGSGYVSRGLFFLEQIDKGGDINSRTATLWGRSLSAKLSEPWAVKISKQWDSETTVAAIMAEVANLCGVTISLDADYDICQYCYAVSDWYPAQIIQDLAEKTGKQIVMPQLDGSIHIAPRLYPPYPLPTITLDPADVQVQGVERTAPTFANRVLVSGDGAVTGITVTVKTFGGDDECVSANGADNVRLLAVVLDRDGSPVNNGTVVEWAVSGGTLASATTTTGIAQVVDEIQQATDYFTVELDLPAAQVIGVYAYGDTGKSQNYMDWLGGTVSGKTITFASKLAYFDQKLRIDYLVSGCATNQWTAGRTPGDVTVLASCVGAQGTTTLHQSNPTACASSIKLYADEACFGDKVTVTAIVTMFDGAGEGPITFTLKSGCGSLSSRTKVLSSRPVIEQLQTQTWGSVSQVKLTAMPVASEPIHVHTDAAPTVNLYDSRTGQTVILNVLLDAGTPVEVAYTAGGTAAISWLPGDITTSDNTISGEEHITTSDASGNTIITLSNTPKAITRVYKSDNPVLEYGVTNVGPIVTILSDPGDGIFLKTDYTTAREAMADCSAVIEAFVEDGSEDGATSSITVNASDCAATYDDDDVTEDTSADDPDDEDPSKLGNKKTPPNLTSCDAADIVKRSQAINASNWKVNAGVPNSGACPGVCTCEQLCQAYRDAGKLAAGGVTYDACITACLQAREDACDTSCVISGPTLMAGGEVGTFTDGRGNTGEISGALQEQTPRVPAIGYHLMMPSGCEGGKLYDLGIKYTEDIHCQTRVLCMPCGLSGPAHLDANQEGSYRIQGNGAAVVTAGGGMVEVRKISDGIVAKLAPGACSGTVTGTSGGTQCGSISVTSTIAAATRVVTGPATMEPGTTDYFAHNLVSFSSGADISVSAPGMVLKQKAGSGFILEMPTGATGSKTVTVTGPCGQTASMTVDAVGPCDISLPYAGSGNPVGLRVRMTIDDWVVPQICGYVSGAIVYSYSTEGLPSHQSDTWYTVDVLGYHTAAWNSPDGNRYFYEVDVE